MMHRNSAGVRDHRIEQKRQNIDPLFGAEHVLEGEVIRWLDPGSHSMTLSDDLSFSEEVFSVGISETRPFNPAPRRLGA